VKKSLIILGSVFLVLILLVAGFVGSAAVRGSALDKESKAYVDGNLPILISTWSEDEVLKRASKELQEEIVVVDGDDTIQKEDEILKAHEDFEAKVLAKMNQVAKEKQPTT